MILVIDHFGSSAYNLAQCFRMFGADVSVQPHDDLRVRHIKVCLPTGIVISSGPGCPSETDISFEVIKYLADRIPILGVGFGHQAIVHAFGGEIVRPGKPCTERHRKFRPTAAACSKASPVPSRRCAIIRMSPAEKPCPNRCS